MKKTIPVLIIVFLINSIVIFSQESKGNKAKRIAFISSQLELTVEESEKFWPILNEMESELKVLRKQKHENRPEKKKVSEMTDKEVDALMLAAFDNKQKELDIKRKYHEKFKSVIPIKKVAKLYHLEHEFRKKRKEGNKPGNDKPHKPNQHHVK